MSAEKIEVVITHNELVKGYSDMAQNIPLDEACVIFIRERLADSGVPIRQTTGLDIQVTTGTLTNVFNKVDYSLTFTFIESTETKG